MKPTWRGKYRVSTPYGWLEGYPLNKNYPAPGKPNDGKDYGFHTGLDVVSENGEILAGTDGVIATGKDAVNGNYIVVTGNKYRQWSAHCRKFVRTSGSVKAGELIAYEGATGAASGVHQHLSVREYGVMVNPAKVIKEKDMLTKKSAAYIVRTSIGESISDKESEYFVGRVTTDEFIDEVKTWKRFKAAEAASKAGRLNAGKFLIWTLRRVYKNPADAVIKEQQATIKSQQAEIEALKAQTSEDTEGLNKLGEALVWLLKRLGVK